MAQNRHKPNADSLDDIVRVLRRCEGEEISVEEISRLCGWSTGTVDLAVRWLISKRFISRERERPGRSYAYRIFLWRPFD